MEHGEFVDLINENKRIIKTMHYRYCRHMCLSDLSQDIILEAWKSVVYFKNNCTFSTWLYNIARNVCVSKIRKRKSAPKIFGLEAYAEVLIEEDNSPELIKQLQQAMRYNTVIDSLEQPYQSLFQAYMEGVSYEELSEQTGITVPSLTTKICTIKKRLKLRYG